MSLNIGNINFGVDANTKGLQNAISQLDAFRKVVDATAKSQVAGANAAATALGRQESAIKRAFQQTLNLQRALRQGGATPGMIARVSNAFGQLTREMTSGQLSAVNFSRSIDAFNAKLNRSNRELKDLKDNDLKKKFSGLVNTLRELQSASVLAIGPLSGLGARITALAAIASRSTIGLAAFIGGTIAGAAALYKLSAAGTQASIAFTRINARLTAVTGSTQEADAQMKFVIKTAMQLGLSINDTADGFSRLVAAAQGTNLAGEEARKIFLGVADASAALGLSNSQTQEIFIAFEQMISKGTVQAQELKQQLGNALPGAFRMAAKAMGVTTQQLEQMLQKGTLVTDQFLPKMVKLMTETFGPVAAQNANRYTGVINNLHNSTLAFSHDFDRAFGVSRTLMGALRGITDVIVTLDEHIRGLAEATGATVGALALLAAPSLARGALMLVEVIQTGAKAMWGMVTATAVEGGALGALGKLAATAVGAFAGFEVMKHYTEGIDSTLKDLNDKLNGIGKNKAGLSLSKNFDTVWQKIKDASDETGILLRIMSDASGTHSSGLVTGLEQARKIIQKLNADDMVQLQENLDKFFSSGTFNTKGKSLESILQDVFAALADSKKEYEAFVQKIANTPEIMRDVNTSFSDLQQKIDAMAKGPRALELYNLTLQRTKALEKLHDQLKRTTLDQGEQNTLMDRYGKMLSRVNYLQDHMSNVSADMAKNLTQGLDDAIFSGKKFGDVLSDLAKKILQITFEDVALKPFENFLSGALGNAFSGGAKNPYAGTASAMGNAWVGGSLVRMAQGGILGGPTLFHTKSGMALGGEAGTEAVLPLTRTASGRLGVYGGVSGGDMIVNIIDQRTDAPAVETKQTQSPNGARQLDILIRDKVKQLHNSGELDRVMGNNYGLTRKGGR